MNKTILVVDDSESIREVVKFTLESHGYNVTLGNDADEAMRCLDGREIDLVITDLHMPGMDGIELIKKIRAMEEYRNTPILLLTTESQTNKKKQAKEAGATGWIIKPFAPNRLIMALNKVIKE